ncbi:hypothetical protein SAY87_004254 [Trapa incisa]|uniref:Dof zinc finger protein n=1 Tax=Trapa incisa TaxID=236973 RepID=A0AAN7JPD7_9MYRT|nr:hypothetical protein SAY87_004254 [Trapa incisa]
MEDIHAIGGEVFVGIVGDGGGGGGTGDRRLRTLHHLSEKHQALKCPRCESLNTKFCYYNNYNLSQPRHFCKDCRRYWTKGGVLRNVPVGGGCRKNKRSKQKSSAPGEPTVVVTSEAATTTTAVQAREFKTNSRSSSESSSLTATTTTAAVEAVSTSSSMKPSGFFNVTEYSSIIAHSMNTEAPGNHGFDQCLPELTSGCGLFYEMENFPNMITSSSEHPSFGFSSVLDQDSLWSQQQKNITDQAGDIQRSNSGCVFFNQTTQVDPPASILGRPSGDEEFGQLDWQPSSDQGLFNDQAFWSWNSQWDGEDHHQPGLFVP